VTALPHVHTAETRYRSRGSPPLACPSMATRLGPNRPRQLQLAILRRCSSGKARPSGMPGGALGQRRCWLALSSLALLGLPAGTFLRAKVPRTRTTRWTQRATSHRLGLHSLTSRNPCFSWTTPQGKRWHRGRCPGEGRCRCAGLSHRCVGGDILR